MIMVKQMLPKGKLILEEIARIELFVTEVRRQKLNNDSREYTVLTFLIWKSTLSFVVLTCQ